MHENTIYIAVVDGKVSHVYSDYPMQFKVVAWERSDPSSIRISGGHGASTEKDKLIAELFHVFKDAPHDDTLLHEEAVEAGRKG